MGHTYINGPRYSDIVHSLGVPQQFRAVGIPLQMQDDDPVERGTANTRLYRHTY